MKDTISDVVRWNVIDFNKRLDQNSINKDKPPSGSGRNARPRLFKETAGRFALSLGVDINPTDILDVIRDTLKQLIRGGQFHPSGVLSETELQVLVKKYELRQRFPYFKTLPNSQPALTTLALLLPQWQLYPNPHHDSSSTPAPSSSGSSPAPTIFQKGSPDGTPSSGIGTDGRHLPLPTWQQSSASPGPTPPTTPGYGPLGANWDGLRSSPVYLNVSAAFGKYSATLPIGASD